MNNDATTGHVASFHSRSLSDFEMNGAIDRKITEMLELVFRRAAKILWPWQRHNSFANSLNLGIS